MSDTIDGQGPLERRVRPQQPDGTSECCTCGYRWRTGQHGGHSCARQLREELDVTDKLLATRDALLRTIPACEAHGDQCVPHAEAWVRNSIQVREALAELVALKDLKDRIALADLATYGVADAEAAQALADDYQRRTPKAWEAARAVLLGPNVELSGHQRPARKDEK